MGRSKNTNEAMLTDKEELVNPLRSEKVIVRFVPSKGGPVGDNPNHVLSGGLADGATIKFGVPMYSSTGNYYNPLTNSEKAFLEQVLDLDYNALSIYKKEKNYWENYYVEVGKDGKILDLSDPEQYIQYKVLLLNSDFVAPDLDTLRDTPKTTYRFVLVKENDESKIENMKMTDTMACYKEFGKIEDDKDTMRILIEIVDVRPLSPNTPVATLRSTINKLIQADPKRFLNAITDPMLHTKVVLRRCVELGVVAMRNDLYYLRSDNSPLCDVGEDSTLPVAAKWLNNPSHQDIKALLESEVSKARNK